MASQIVLRCDGSGIETVARQFAVISWRDYFGISRKQRKLEPPAVFIGTSHF
jgi:hypothetical protein